MHPINRSAWDTILTSSFFTITFEYIIGCERLLTMASKALLLLSLIVVILIASEVAARDLADSSAENKNNEKPISNPSENFGVLQDECFGFEKEREKKECKLTSMEGIQEEGTEDTQVGDMAETAVVDTVVGADTEDVEEDTVAMVVATEATTVAALGAVLMLVRLFKLSRRVLIQLTRKSCILDSSCCNGCEV
ncbi:unnamed protein product [Brassica oleracea var. botrytis]